MLVVCPRIDIAEGEKLKAVLRSLWTDGKRGTVTPPRRRSKAACPSYPQRGVGIKTFDASCVDA
eukprot:15230907-Alexandrium_andersonii.AAC.1